MTNEPTSMDFEIDKTVGNEGEYGVKFNEPTTHEYAAYECQECGFNGDVEIINKTVTCPVCGTVNDVWKEGEAPPPNHRDKPTTGEMIYVLRENGDVYFGETEITCDQIADRLESQEQTIAEKEASNDRLTTAVAELTMKVGELTARAESAERERDAAIGHVHDAIFGTNHSCFYCTMENCDGCTNSTVKEHFKYRGIHPNKYLVKQEYEQDGGAE